MVNLPIRNSGSTLGRDQTSQCLKSGMTTVESVKVFIPAEHLPDDLKFNAGKDIVVKGITDFEFDNTSQQTISASLKTLKEQNDKVPTVSIVDEKCTAAPGCGMYSLAVSR